MLSGQVIISENRKKLEVYYLKKRENATLDQSDLIRLLAVWIKKQKKQWLKSFFNIIKSISSKI